ncbi:hypothetical protein HK098_003048 [Nowakowskiella sp. JEL0407]|nr:hypothetical protein HK098_003048 [Nowakowskiella sp. JEL0407]
MPSLSPTPSSILTFFIPSSHCEETPPHFSITSEENESACWLHKKLPKFTRELSLPDNDSFPFLKLCSNQPITNTLVFSVPTNERNNPSHSPFLRKLSSDGDASVESRKRDTLVSYAISKYVPPKINESEVTDSSDEAEDQRNRSTIDDGGESTSHHEAATFNLIKSNSSIRNSDELRKSFPKKIAPSTVDGSVEVESDNEDDSNQLAEIKTRVKTIRNYYFDDDHFEDATAYNKVTSETKPNSAEKNES